VATVAIIDSYETLADGSLHVQGLFTDQATFKTPFALTVAGNITAEQLRAQLARVNDAMAAQTALKALIVPGTSIDLTPPVVVVPDPTPQQKFLTLWGQYQSALRKVTGGIVAADAKEVVDLQTATVAAYDAAFVGIG
jgi:hypothetical protein